jgi:hypothetical protein
MVRDRAHVDKLSQRLLEGIRSKLDGVILNGSEEHRYPGNVNLSFAYVEGESRCFSFFRTPSVSLFFLPFSALRPRHFAGHSCRSDAIKPIFRFLFCPI